MCQERLTWVGEEAPVSEGVPLNLLVLRLFPRFAVDILVVAYVRAWVLEEVFNMWGFLSSLLYFFGSSFFGFLRVPWQNRTGFITLDILSLESL